MVDVAYKSDVPLFLKVYGDLSVIIWVTEIWGGNYICPGPHHYLRTTVFRGFT